MNSRGKAGGNECVTVVTNAVEMLECEEHERYAVHNVWYMYAVHNAIHMYGVFCFTTFASFVHAQTYSTKTHFMPNPLVQIL